MSRWSVVLLGDDDGAVLARIEDARSAMTVVRSCFELSEALASVTGGMADALILIGRPEDLTLSLVESVRDAGARMVVMADAASPAAGTTPDWGIVTIPLDATVELIAQALETEQASVFRDPGVSGTFGEAGGPHRGGSVAEARHDTVQEQGFPLSEAPLAGTSADTDLPAAERLAEPSGRCLAVWGPLGAPGTTTVAINLAVEAASRGLEVCLVDADILGASIAASVGLLEEGSGLSRACRAAERDQLTAETFREYTDRIRIGKAACHVLTGITRPDRWIEIREAALRAVLGQARTIFDVVVVDTSFTLEREEELDFDPGAPQRNAATITAVTEADEVVVLGQADAIGIPRLVRAVEELRENHPEVHPRVVVNKLRDGAVSAEAENEVRGAWLRFGPPVPLELFLPQDQTACDKALLWATSLGQAAPKSPLTAAVRKLGDLLLDGASSTPVSAPRASSGPASVLAWPARALRRRRTSADPAR